MTAKTETQKRSTTSAVNANGSNEPGAERLRAGIAEFLRRRRIEAIAAASLVALSSYSQAYALSVSDINVTSALGQPLRATLNITTASDEFLNARCIRITAPSAADMPGVGGVSLAISTSLNTSTLKISGTSPMREPMSELVLQIDCSGAPAFTRSFLVLLDPPGALTAAAQPIASAQAPQAVRRFGPTATRGALDARAPVARTAPRRAPASTRTPIAPGSNYVIQPGDILSVVASRVAGRPDYSVWPIAQRIYDTNPAAFESQDPSSLRVGATLRIPELTGRLAIAGTRQQERGVRWRSATQAATLPTPREPEATVTEPIPAPVSAPAPAPAPAPVARSLKVAEPAARRNAIRPNDAIANRPRTWRTFAFTHDFSGLSLDRLRQRRLAGDVGAAASSRPNDAVTRRRQTGETAQAQPTETAAPVAPVIIERPVRRDTPLWFFGLVAVVSAALGGLATLFGLRGWLATRRQEQEESLARAKRHQARLEESRRKRTADEIPSIVVHEEMPRVDLPRVDISSGPSIESIGSVEEVLAAGNAAATDTIDALLKDDHVLTQSEASEGVVAGKTDDFSNDAESVVEDKEPTLSVDTDVEEHPLDFDAFEAPDESALEMLERDYAQSQANVDVGDLAADPEATAMLTPEQLGVSAEDATQLLSGVLDLELPEGSPEDTIMNMPGIDKQGADTDDELTEVAMKLNETLLNMDTNLPVDNDPTAESPILNAADDPDEDDDPTRSLNTREDEDYYHLEASSIRKIEPLGFEDSDDDEDTRIVSSIRK